MEPIVFETITGFVYGIRLKNSKSICFINYSFAQSDTSIKSSFSKRFNYAINTFDYFILDVFECKNDPWIRKLNGRKHSDALILQYNPTLNDDILTTDEYDEKTNILQEKVEAMQAGKLKKLREKLKILQNK